MILLMIETDVNLSDDDPDSPCDNDNARRLLRRLSHIEYDNTVQDLFGLNGSVSFICFRQCVLGTTTML